MNKASKTIGVIAVIAVILGGYYFLKGGYGVRPPEPSGEPSKIINVAGSDFSFSPDAIAIKSGEIVKINLINNGGSPHNLTIRNFNIATQTVAPGKTGSITFVAPPAGEYTFFCSIGNHENIGMKGTLKVE